METHLCQYNFDNISIDITFYYDLYLNENKNILWLLYFNIYFLNDLKAVQIILKAQ